MPSGAAAAYAGLGDLLATGYFWGGLRAYNVATATAHANAVQVRRASDSTLQNIPLLSTGALDTASALTFAGVDATGTGSITATTLTFTGGHVGDTVTGGTVAPGTYIVSGASPTWTVNISQTVTSATLTLTWGLYVRTLYNQTSGSAIHWSDMVQTTAAFQPQLLLNGGGPSGTLPWMRFTGSASQFLPGTNGTNVVQPLTVSWVGTRLANFTSNSPVYSFAAATATGGFTTVANTMFQSAGTLVTIGSTPDLAWYAVQDVFNGASSVHCANGTSTTTNPGASGATSPNYIGTNYIQSNMITGGITEVGLWPIAFSGANNSAMNANQRSYWGF